MSELRDVIYRPEILSLIISGRQMEGECSCTRAAPAARQRLLYMFTCHKTCRRCSGSSFSDDTPDSSTALNSSTQTGGRVLQTGIHQVPVQPVLIKQLKVQSARFSLHRLCKLAQSSHLTLNGADITADRGGSCLFWSMLLFFGGRFNKFEPVEPH